MLLDVAHNKSGDPAAGTAELSACPGGEASPPVDSVPAPTPASSSTSVVVAATMPGTVTWRVVPDFTFLSIFKDQFGSEFWCHDKTSEMVPLPNDNEYSYGLRLFWRRCCTTTSSGPWAM